jgi:Leucine-rich repeat (LRR) protein
MTSSFTELFSQIIAQNKHEVSLNGDKLVKLLENNGGKLDAGLFKLKQLNFIQLVNSHMLENPGNWDELPNLQHLQLYGNKLTALPGENYLKFYFNFY